MKTTIAKLIMLTGLGVLIGTPPRALADEWDQKTIFTFSGPVEIPGQVLTAGTYVFKLADSQSDRNIVQVYNKGRNTSLRNVPDYSRPTDTVRREGHHNFRREAR